MKKVYIVTTREADNPFCRYYPELPIVFTSEADAFDFIMSEYEAQLFESLNWVTNRMMHFVDGKRVFFNTPACALEEAKRWVHTYWEILECTLLD